LKGAFLGTFLTLLHIYIKDMATKIKWEEADFKWEAAPPSEDYKPGFAPSSFPFKWNDVALIIEEIAEQVDDATVGGIVETAVKALEPEKKKKLIRLIMYRKGIEIYDESKEVKNIDVHVDEIRTIIEEAKIQMQVENIHV